MTVSTAVVSLANRYRLVSELGHGGMGVVWKARDELLHRDVAVKELTLPPGIPDDERRKLIERTFREARAVAAIDTPAAIRVFDILEHDGRPWIVMELLAGQSLTEVLRARGPLPPAEVATIGLAVLEALEVAHTAGVVHRDVKPSNVIVGDDGRIALADFGVATVESDPGDTTTGVLIGSPGYMAPERANGKPPTAASDMWSLGATLWTAAQGRPPYDGPTPITVLTSIAMTDAPPCAECPRSLAEVVANLMSRDPEARPSYAETRAALESVRRTETETQPVVTATALIPPAFDRTTTLVPYPDERPNRSPVPTAVSPGVADAPTAEPGRGRSRAALVGALVAGLVLLAAGGAWWVMSRSGDGSTPAPSAAHARQHSAHRGSGATGNGATAATVPPGWTTYHDPTLGWRIGVPGDWTATPDGAGGATFSDPAGGRHLQVATRYPAGPSAVGAWRDQERAFAAGHAGYQRIRLESITAPAGASDAADWEFTYVQGGVTIHAIDRAMVFGDRGYALFFQTTEDQWNASSSLLTTFTSSFTPSS